MNITNKLIDILSLQSIAVKVKSVYKNIQKVFDAGYAAGYEEGVETDPQWNAYCLKTGEHFDLPEGMTVIPEYMFQNHTELKSVSIPDTVTEIGEYAFKGSGIDGIQLPENVKTIMEHAFEDCKDLYAAVLSPSLTDVEYEIFAGNCDLCSVTFVKTSSKDGTIKAGTPTSMSDLVDNWYLEDEYGETEKDTQTDIYVPWSEGEVPGAPWGFKYATIHYNFWDNIPEVFTFPQGFVKIPDYLFYDTTATTAKEIYLGDECEEIGEAAFYKAKNLETVYLPDGLKKIGAYAFRYSSALNCSELPDSVEEIANRAFHGSSISLTKLPTNIKELGIRCFQGCSGNMFTEIPAGIVRISAEAFMNNTGLTKLIFLSTPEVDKVVKGIASDAFAGCTNLVEIGVPWSEGEVSGAPWGAENATIIYDWKEG